MFCNEVTLKLAETFYNGIFNKVTAYHIFFNKQNKNPPPPIKRIMNLDEFMTATNTKKKNKTLFEDEEETTP